MIFEIKAKDGMGRLGVITTPHGSFITPALMPVVNLRNLVLTIDQMVSTGAEAFISNAFLIYQDPELKSLALERGLHELLGYDGPLMTDSGAFQAMRYGDVPITNKKITQFQESIKTDIGVFLDVPIAKGTKERYLLGLEKTLERADEHISIRQDSEILWTGPIQGGPFPDLVAQASTKMSEKDFAIYAIGSVVPLMEQYRFGRVVSMILSAKEHLPPSRPVHLFGAGHPMFFALSVYLGCDIFDSAAYALFAKEDRYLTPRGTLHLSNLNYLPCGCPVCANTNAVEFNSLDIEEKTKKLALHNLFISFAEIRTVRQAISDGRLLELVIERSMAHPRLAKAIELLFKKDAVNLIDTFEPRSKKRALLLSHPLAIKQVMIQRFKKKVLERFLPWSDSLYLSSYKPKAPKSWQICLVSPIFGIIPKELKFVFPVLQSVNFDPGWTMEAEEPIKTFLEKYHSQFSRIWADPSIHFDFKEFGVELMEKKDFPEAQQKLETPDLRAIIDFQFGEGLNNEFPTLVGEYSKKTRVLRRISDGEVNLANYRSSDSTLVPQPLLVRAIHKHFASPWLRVIASQDAIPFVSSGKDLLAKFVSEVDPQIRAGDEVLIVNKADELLARGKALLSPNEMLSVNRGVAVKVRGAL